MSNRAILGFSGALIPASMADFAQHRAERLALGLALLENTPQRLRAALSGPADLIDAFEMALSLGPRDSVVNAVWREDWRDDWCEDGRETTENPQEG